MTIFVDQNRTTEKIKTKGLKNMTMEPQKKQMTE